MYKICYKCNTENQGNRTHCFNCGSKLYDDDLQGSFENIKRHTYYSNVSSSKQGCNKWVAFFLCLFLGAIGAHRFYEKKIASGIVYLLTCGLLGIGIIIDLIIILAKPTYY